MTDVRCGMCGLRLSRAKTKPAANTSLLLCTNCGCVFLEIQTEQDKNVYKFLGKTHGNNEVREILNMEELT